ncbi:Chitinase 2, partial [Linderina macrospora]
CPYPDAYLGSVMSSAWFDMVFVQFYNNYCGLNAYPTWFNYNDWDNWAKTVSANKDVKIFIGAPGSSSAASTGYVNASTLQSIYNSVRSNYTSLGGIMTWDVSQARASGLASSIRSMLNSGGSCGSSGGSTTTLPSSTTSTTVITSTAAPITSTSTAAPITSTTSSAQPTSTSTGTCPVNGAGCTGNQQGCSGSSFALCNNGKWVLQSCASGTYCYLSGSTATCDWANGRPTTGCAISGTSLRKRQDLVKVNKITKPNLRPKPVKAAGNVATRVEFVVGDITDNTYTTALKISSLQSAFSGNWSISFTLPVGQTAESSSRGAVSISGNTVTIKSNPAAEKSKNMATTIKLVGTFTGDYVLPDSSSAKFTSN